MAVDLPLLQRAIVHVSLLSCWSRFPGSAPAHMGDICRIILPVCSYLLLPPSLPSSSSLSLCMTFLHSSPADRGVLSALSFSPPHTTSCSLPPPPRNLSVPLISTPRWLLLPSLSHGSAPWITLLPSLLPSPPLAVSLFCPLQLNILCFLIRPTH